MCISDATGGLGCGSGVQMHIIWEGWFAFFLFKIFFIDFPFGRNLAGRAGRGERIHGLEWILKAVSYLHTTRKITNYLF